MEKQLNMLATAILYCNRHLYKIQLLRAGRLQQLRDQLESANHQKAWTTIVWRTVNTVPLVWQWHHNDLQPNTSLAISLSRYSSLMNRYATLNQFTLKPFKTQATTILLRRVVVRPCHSIGVLMSVWLLHNKNHKLYILSSNNLSQFKIKRLRYLKYYSSI